MNEEYVPEHDSPLDGGLEAEAKATHRRCIVTRAEGLPAEMVRFAISPTGVLVPDLDARLPGRGIWLSARRDVIEQARIRGAFARAARMQLQVPDDLPTQVEAGLLRRMIEIVGLARRAGQAVSGFVKVREWMAQHRVGAIVHALDGSREERDRLLSGGRDIPVIETLTSVELARIFGRERVVNVALAAGGLATRLCNENKRFAGVSQDSSRVLPDLSGGRV